MRLLLVQLTFFRIHSQALDDAGLEDSENISLSKKEAKNQRKTVVGIIDRMIGSHNQKKDLRQEKKSALAKMKDIKKIGGLNLITPDQIFVEYIGIPIHCSYLRGPIKVRNNLRAWKSRYGVIVSGRLIYFKDKGEYVRFNSSGIVNLKGYFGEMSSS